MGRVEHHPILPVPERNDIMFNFEGQELIAKEGEVISSALIANDIHIFGFHRSDGAPQGIYCANGQCSQCTVIANGLPVKACMTAITPGITVSRCKGDPRVLYGSRTTRDPQTRRNLRVSKALTVLEDTVPSMKEPRTVRTNFLIIGGGPAGLTAAIELVKHGVHGILIDDKRTLGGKLTLQTHNFFGSRSDCYAGTRGIDIASKLEEELKGESNGRVQVWLDATAVGVFCDQKIGIVRSGVYTFVKPKVLLVAAGAREKTLAFPGCDLPGIYGAGAFQTLVNRDLIRPTERLFVCGGGNVGLISAYHALQAGIDVVGLAEALPECGGYRVHLDKLRSLGVPVYTSHTVVKAFGKDHLEELLISEIDERFRPLNGTVKRFQVDTLLIAVGLSPIREIYVKAKEYGMKVRAAGDAEEIAEASAAMFSGRIAGRKMVRDLGKQCIIPGEWNDIVSTLRSKPGKMWDFRIRQIPGKVYPVIRCIQEIPCDPCTQLCPRGAIRIQGDRITAMPVFKGEMCLGCAKCVIGCPGLAIVLVDERFDPTRKKALITLPFELGRGQVKIGQRVTTVGLGGEPVGKGRVVASRETPSQDRRRLLLLEVPFAERLLVSGFRIRDFVKNQEGNQQHGDDDTIICRCERVTKGKIVELIRAGYRDMNQIKAVLRTGMGACGGKTCADLILGLFREEGVDLREVTPFVERPPLYEVPLGAFAGVMAKKTMHRSHKEHDP